jgi:hypothetical protein
VLAQAVDLNVFDNDHLTVSLMKERIVDDFIDIDLVTFGQEQQRFCIPQWCSQQALAVWILTHAFDQRSPPDSMTGTDDRRPESSLTSLAMESARGLWAGLLTLLRRISKARERSFVRAEGLLSRCLFPRLRLLTEEVLIAEEFVVPAISRISGLGSSAYLMFVMRSFARLDI